MANRTVKVTLQADVAGFNNGFRTAGKSVGDFKKQFDDALKSKPQELAQVTSALTGVGVVLTGVAAIGVKKFADFDQAMSNVASTGAEAKAAIKQLEAAALDAGASTVFSATEAAGAIEELAKAGLSTADILKGGLTGALDLAAAGGLEVARAAEITSVALTQFKLGGDQAAHVADLLAAGAGKAMGDVEDLGSALAQGGLVASQTGLSIEETTGALAAFASAGLLGSDAGTSLKTMLQRLTPQSKEAQAQFDALGVSAYDAQGNFVGLENFAGQLQTAMKDLSPEARNAAMSVMFGSDAVRAASVLYEQGADGINTWIEAVDDQGYAAETAATKLDNLKGDLEALGGAMETAFIKSGSGANEVLRGLTQAATSLVEVVADMPGPLLATVGGLTGVVGVGALAAGGLSKAYIAAKDVNSAFRAIGLSAPITARSVKAVGLAAGVATTALTAMAIAASYDGGDSSQGYEEMADNIRLLGEGAYATDTIFKNIDFGAGRQADLAGYLANLKSASTGIKGWGRDLKHGLADLVGADARDGFALMTTELNAFDQAMAGLATTDIASVSSAFEMLNMEAGGTRESAGQLLAVMPELKDALIGVAQGANLATDDNSLLSIALGEVIPAANGVDEAVSGVVATYEANAKAVQESWDALDTWINGALSAERAAMAYEAAVDAANEAISENGKTLDITTEKGRANRNALLDIADAGFTNIQSLRDQAASEGALQDAMSATRADFIKTARQMGMTKAEARAYADQLGLIPSNIRTDVTANVGGAEAAVNSFIARMQQKRITIQVAAGGSPAKSLTAVQRAGGGSVFGPGTETSDSIPALLSNNEHVWSAAEVRGAGGHGALERMRAMAKAGVLPAFASGGAVSSAVSRVDRAREEVAAAKKSKDDKRLRRAEKALDAALDELRDLRGSLAEYRAGAGARNFTYDPKTGGVLASTALFDKGTSGLSGAYDLVGMLKDLSKLDGLSKKMQKSLGSSAVEARKNFEKLYKEAARLEGKLEKAQGHFAEMQSVKSGVANGLTNAFSLGDAIQGPNATGHTQKASGASFVAHAKAYVKKLKAFSSVLKKLAGWGLSSTILQEIAGYGVDDGFSIASSLSKSQVQELNGAYKSIDAFSQSIGSTATRNFVAEDGTVYKGGISESYNTVKAIEKQISKNEKAIAKQTDKVLDALGKPFKLTYNSKTGRLEKIAKKAGGGFVYGPGSGTSDDVPALLSNGEFVVRAAVAQQPSNAALLRSLNAGGRVSVPSPVIDYDRLAAAFAAQPVVVQTVVSMSGRQMAEWHGEGQRQLERLSR